MKTDDYYVNNSKDYKPPQYVERLPPRVPIGGGEAITIDEVNKKIKLNNLNYIYFFIFFLIIN
jgi:hypothetical protein